MDDGLTKDEFEALRQIGTGPRHGRVSACVARNAKRLAGLKYIAFGKDGGLTMTEKGKQTLFVKSCIDGLRAVSTDALAPLAPEVASFLGKKGHIVPNTAAGGFEITRKGRESLADIDAAAD